MNASISSSQNPLSVDLPDVQKKKKKSAHLCMVHTTYYNLKVRMFWCNPNIINEPMYQTTELNIPGKYVKVL